MKINLVALLAVAQARHQKNYVLLRDIDSSGVIGSDNIASASPDDMFAFSQVVASGGNVLQTVKELEKQAVEIKK